jgi:hypothetical protein
MTKASFISHRVTDEGLYIMGITGPGLLPDVETFVPRDDAEEFGWLDPLEEEAQTEETPTPEWFAEMQRLTSENAALRKIALDTRLNMALRDEIAVLRKLMSASSIVIRDVLEVEAFRLSEGAATKLDEIATHLQEVSK